MDDRMDSVPDIKTAAELYSQNCYSYGDLLEGMPGSGWQMNLKFYDPPHLQPVTQKLILTEVSCLQPKCWGLVSKTINWDNQAN